MLKRSQPLAKIKTKTPSDYSSQGVLSRKTISFWLKNTEKVPMIGIFLEAHGVSFFLWTKATSSIGSIFKKNTEKTHEWWLQIGMHYCFHLFTYWTAPCQLSSDSVPRNLQILFSNFSYLLFNNSRLTKKLKRLSETYGVPISHFLL